MQIDRDSFLLGLVVGLTLAAVTIAGSILMAPRSQPAVAAAQTALASTAPAATATRALPSPTSTPAPTAQPTATPAPTATPTRPAPPATLEPPRYQSVDVPPRRNVQVSIGAASGQVLDLAIMVDSDIDLTITDPSGATVYGPTRVRRSYAGQLRSPATGNFVLKLDNSFSIITSKTVLVQYRLLRT